MEAVVCALVVDCDDPVVAAAFWQALLGGEVRPYPDVGVEALRAPGITFDFVRSTDEKAAKNRLHLDLATDDPDATRAAALGLGATDAPDVTESPSFFVMRDPVGNEFCILREAPMGDPWAPPPSAQA